jgi:cobalamin transport system substrate-binding protein
MGQLLRMAAGAILLAAMAGCGRGHGAAESIPAAAPAVAPRVATITPAGTDLLVGMGAADHLVAVSNYDEDRPETAGKPRIGDYQSIDWEKLAPLHPQILIVFYAADRIPSVLQQQCDSMGIQIFNVKLEELDDIYREAEALGQAVGEQQRADAAVANLKSQLASVAARVAGRPVVKTLIVTGDSGLDIAGPHTFLDEIVTIAGGQNVAAVLGKRYSTVDGEMLASLAPDAVIQLIPDGEKTPQVVQQAKQFWDSMGDLPSVKNHRVYIVTDWYAEQPGFHVGDLASEFADLLHPETKAH